MTATNHALTGAAIALAVKKPELAIPLAFLSHFVLDMVPHYNPPGATKQTFKNLDLSWAKKFSNSNFKYIFTADMLIFATILIASFFIAPMGVSGWTVFLSAMAGAAPDFWGGRILVYKALGWQTPSKPDLYTRLHIRFHGVERPWGIWVELVWFILVLVFIKSRL